MALQGNILERKYFLEFLLTIQATFLLDGKSSSESVLSLLKHKVVPPPLRCPQATTPPSPSSVEHVVERNG